MGQLVLNELNLSQSNRVLGRWMAHRIAELMRRVETATDSNAKEVAERECQDLIVRLWDMRDRWPSGGPLRDILPTLHQLLDNTPYRVRWAGKPEQPSVGGVITKLLRAQRKELRQLCQLIKSKTPAHTVQELQQLLDENYDDLSEEEVALITLIVAPSRLPIFNSEAEAGSYEDVVVGDEEEVLEEPQVAPSDEYAEFQKDVMLSREKFLASVGELLGN